MAGKTSKRVFNFMALVKCPLGSTVWANNSDKGLRCTKCNGTGHDKVTQ